MIFNNVERAGADSNEFNLNSGRERILTYEEACSILIKKAPDPVTREMIREIFEKGQYGNFSVSPYDKEIPTRDTIAQERERRILYASLLVTYPKTFKAIEKDDIDLFHGFASDIEAKKLLGVLVRGLLTASYLKRSGEEELIAEKWSIIEGHERSFTSFTIDMKPAADYGEMSDEKNTFPILIGISHKALRDSGIQTRKGYSDLQETVIDGNLPAEQIKAIFVPENKIDLVKKLVEEASRITGRKLEIEVLPLEIDKFPIQIDDFGRIVLSKEEEQFIL